MDAPKSIAGQIRELMDRGYTSEQILLELKSRGLNVKKQRINDVIRKARGRSEDSRRLFEVYEAILEILGIVRDMRTERQKQQAARAVLREERRLAERRTY